MSSRKGPPPLAPPEPPPSEPPRHLILVVRADPVICGHATEARQLAEAAIAPGGGFKSVHIVTYPLDVLAASNLPLHQPGPDGLLPPPYSPGITVHRPPPLGSPHKVLDGRVLQGMSACLLDLLTTPRLEGLRMVMGLYLVPHAQVVLEAARTARAYHARKEQRRRGRSEKRRGSDVEGGGRERQKKGGGGREQQQQQQQGSNGDKCGEGREGGREGGGGQLNFQSPPPSTLTTTSATTQDGRRRRRGRDSRIVTVAKAVGTDVTGHLTQAVEREEWGAAQLLLEQYLGHDVLLAVSDFTRTCLVEAAGKVDEALAGREEAERREEGEEEEEEEAGGGAGFYASELERRVVVSYPPFDISTGAQTEKEEEQTEVAEGEVRQGDEDRNEEDDGIRRKRAEIWARHGVEEQKYVLFLSRWSEGKGMEDLVQGYLGSNVCAEKKWPLLLCTTLPAGGGGGAAAAAAAAEPPTVVSLDFAMPRTPPPASRSSSSSSAISSPVSSLSSSSSSSSSSPSSRSSSASNPSAPSSPSSLLQRLSQHGHHIHQLDPRKGSTSEGNSSSNKTNESGTTSDSGGRSSSSRGSKVLINTDSIRIVEGVTDAEEKAALFYGCAAFVLPSKATPSFTETFGIVVVEKALAGGLGPVLTTRTGGLLEATGGHCVEIEPSSPQGITRQLDWVCGGGMGEAIKRVMANAARTHASLMFDRAKVLRELLELVEGVEEGEDDRGNADDD